ncbi:PilN domain-containing protein [Patescibacteria group bacterium]|nr:PilN domain-containing protein [Patescibacteria group bacterium]
MINLLPPQYKEELKQIANFKLVLVSGGLVLFFLIFTILALFLIRTQLLAKVEAEKTTIQVKEHQLEESELQDFREKVKTANRDILRLNSFYQGQHNLAKVLEKTSESFPSGLYLTSLSYQKNVSQVSLSGFSPTQEALFELKKNLEAKEDFAEVYFPLSNWINLTDINFYATLKVISQ